MYEEALFPLEPNLIIPKSHKPTEVRSLKKGSLILLEPARSGYVTATFSDGDTFTVLGRYDLPKLFKSRYNWTLSRFNELDCLLKVLTKDEIMELDTLGYLDFGSFQLNWRLGSSKIRYTELNDPVSSRYLINLDPFTVKNFVVSSFNDLDLIVTKFISLSKLLRVNPISPASTAKDLLLAENPWEFEAMNHLTRDDLTLIRSCYKGPRMETRSIGTMPGVQNTDLVKAYLSILGELPSIQSRNAYVYRGTQYCDDAHPGSAFKISVSIDRRYFHDFPPIPVTKKGRTIYPHGEFITHVSKPYVETCEEMKIPYKILDSIQFIPIRQGYKPFNTLAKMIAYFEDTMKASLYPINLKGLHFAMVGHFLHVHQNINPRTGELTYQTSQDYNPVYACAIQGLVAQRIWNLTQIQTIAAIRVDAITGHRLKEGIGFRNSPPGTMTFLTPNLKDKPGETVYRDLIGRFRDRKAVEIPHIGRKSYKQASWEPREIGKPFNNSVSIPPSAGGRLLPERIQRIGVLLDDQIKTIIPHIDNDADPDREQAWVNNYLALFPQTPS